METGSLNSSYKAFCDEAGTNPNSLLRVLNRHLWGERTAALDVGAGNFRNSKYLIETLGFERVDAIDNNPEVGKYYSALEQGVKARVRFHKIDFKAFALVPKSYNLVVATAFFHLLQREEVFSLIPAILRAMRPNGVFVRTVLMW